MIKLILNPSDHSFSVEKYLKTCFDIVVKMQLLMLDFET